MPSPDKAPKKDNFRLEITIRGGIFRQHNPQLQLCLPHSILRNLVLLDFATVEVQFAYNTDQDIEVLS